MSSTEPRQEKALIAFYRENLSGIKEKTMFPEITPGAESYWQSRTWRPLERKDFEIALGDAAEAAATLDRFWAGTSFEGLGKKLGQLSQKFPEPMEKSDVSSSIYEMF
jgi:hypothetical protein